MKISLFFLISVIHVVALLVSCNKTNKSSKDDFVKILENGIAESPGPDLKIFRIVPTSVCDLAVCADNGMYFTVELHSKHSVGDKIETVIVGFVSGIQNMTPVSILHEK